MTISPVQARGFSVAIGSRSLFAIDSFELSPRTSTVIVGKTGSGKSVFLKAIAGLLPAKPFILGGNLSLHGVNGYENGKKTKRSVWQGARAKGICYVPAESAQAMNPGLTLEQNLRVLAPGARETVSTRLKGYFSLDFNQYARKYPDEVSGGELQRITLMILLSGPAELMLLDEPTVNLDRQLRKNFIGFLNDELLRNSQKTILMASHDLDFVRALNVGAIVEMGSGGLKPIPSLPEAADFQRSQGLDHEGPGLELREVSQHYMARGLFGNRKFWAFKNLSVAFRPAHVYGITGPSGCGKTSMIKSILRLIDGTTGTIELDGQNLVELKPRERGNDPLAFMPYRRRMAIVQQDSRYSFFPDLTIRQSTRHIAKTLCPLDEGYAPRLDSLMSSVGLAPSHLDVRPGALSSGEMKRMDIARALAQEPEIILLDEPFAHIDFATRATVMKAISAYLEKSKAILIVVTHEDFDLRYFVETSYDFLQLVQASRGA